MMLMSASLLQKGDVAVAFSYSGQTLIVLEAARQARKNGAHVIAITNCPRSRLTQVAHVVLCATVEDSPPNRGKRGSPHGAIEPAGRPVHGRGTKQPHSDLSRTMSVVRILRASW
jgi:RpiR family transcriptional regulator, repressor of rpiB and als operon